MKLKKRYIAILLVAVIAIGFGIFNQRKKREPVGPSVDEIMKELLEFDANGDGQISKNELPERMQGIIARGDVNQDGSLNQDELRKMAQAQSDATQHAANNEKRNGERQNQESEK